jgi:LytS/YehU family sensor histidine kinase
MVFAIIPALTGFYTFYFFIFEKYLARKKLLTAFGLALLSSGLAAIVTEVILYSFYNIDRSVNTIIFSGLSISFLALVNGALGLVMKGFITWYNDIQEKLELNKKNHDMELALIKAQINPHFLFNTINNIDTLIKKDASSASDYLNKLSDIMRFMLYESKSEKIPLAKEIAYIDKYIELQKIRTSNENFVTYDVTGDTTDIAIEPMLLIPFIENAFKHSGNKKIREAIRILLKVDKDKLGFECVNAYSDSQIASLEGGLGNELIKRRLELLYPNKHTFEINNTGGYYSVRLGIDIK